MKAGKFDFKTKDAFNGFVIYVSGALIFFGVVALTANVIAGSIVTFIGIVGVTTQERLMIDFDKKVYRLYVRLLGFKIGNVERFQSIEYIFVKTNKVVEKVNSLAGAYQSSDIHKIHFDAYIRFSETDKVHLLGKEDKESVMKFVRPLAAKLGVQVVDYTTQ